MTESKFEIFKSDLNNEYYFRLKAVNNEIILSSEAYTTKQNAQKGINSVKENAQNGSNFENMISNNSQFYFVLKAKNHEIIGTSEMYTTESAREVGIKSVKKNAQKAKIIDLT